MIRRVDNHPSLLDERQTQDGIDGDVGPARDAEMGWMAFTSQVGEVELEAHSEVGGHRLASLLDDAAEGDRCVVGLAVDGRYRVGVRFSDRGEEMKVSG